MCNHSSDLKLNWIQEGVACLCLKEEGQNPLVPGGSELPPGGGCCCLVWDVLWDVAPHSPAWSVQHGFTGLLVPLLVIAA